MTTQQVAEIVGCHPGTIACKAMKFGLKKLTPKISIEELKYLYIEKGLTAREIALLHGYAKSSITSYLCKHNITRKGMKNT